MKKALNLAELGTALAFLAENGNKSIIEGPGLNAAKHWKKKTEIILRMQAQRDQSLFEFHKVIFLLIFKPEKRKIGCEKNHFQILSYIMGNDAQILRKIVDL